MSFVDFVLNFFKHSKLGRSFFWTKKTDKRVKKITLYNKKLTTFQKIQIVQYYLENRTQNIKILNNIYWLCLGNATVSVRSLYFLFIIAHLK